MMPNLGQGGGMAIEDALVLSLEVAKLNEQAASSGRTEPSVPSRERLEVALRRYNLNRVLRAASVQGLSRVSSAFLFQYQPPLDIDWSAFPPRLSNYGPRSLITRACQGFLQHVAFPLQFEFLFSFPGQLKPELFEEFAEGDFAAATPQTQRASGPSVVGEPEKQLLSGATPVSEWFKTYW